MTTNPALLQEIIETFDKPSFITTVRADMVVTNEAARSMYNAGGAEALFRAESTKAFLGSIAKSTNVRFDKIVDHLGQEHRVAGKRLDRNGHLMLWFEKADSQHDMAGFTSEVKKREAETSKRRAMEKSSKDLVAASGDMVLIVARTGEILESSESFHKLTGIHASATLNQQVKRYVFLGLKEGVDGWALQTPLCSAVEGYIQGRERRIPIEVTLKPIVWKGKDATLYSIHDLSETQRAESAIQRMRLLEETQKKAEMASLAKSRLIRAISHEMRTPLNGMFLSLDILEDGMTLSGADKRLFQTLKKSTERLLGQVDNIMSFVQSDTPSDTQEQTAIDVGKVLNALYTENVSRTQARHLDGTLVNNIGSHMALGKESVLQSLFQSLYIEALASPEGASVRVECDSVVHDTHITYRLSITAPTFRSKLGDGNLARKVYSGQGSDKHKQETIDLNLWISQNAILELGGSLTFEEAGEDSASAVATFSFPRASQPRPVIGSVSDQLPQDLSVMIVDDEPINRKVLTLLLKKNGNAVWTAENGQEAVELAIKYKPDLVIMDLNMPVMDGISATREILSQAALAHTKVIGATAYMSDEIEAECLGAGMLELVAKPLRKEKLFHALSRHLSAQPPIGATY
ncbi:response regulator [Donghicola eburneus]|uniref:response regulator n=1 Tax=Donghicola eburneus TaxID=393278 RepID=UPI0008E25EF2|nr:response regulator [Donghicola eburneus]SFQ68165.1 CheY chemotaxis protein or a CheY-like REC (receiver) domain [Donghicola eburneus]